MNFNLKTGYSVDSENQYQDQYQEQLLKDLIVIIGVFIEDASELASIYCVHSGRNSVTTKDVELGLKTRAFHGDIFWNSPDIQQKIAEMKEFLYNVENEEVDEEMSEEMSEEMNEEMNEEMSEEMNEEMSEEVNEEMSEGTQFIQSTCTCQVCTSLNEIVEKWNTWHPKERMDKSIKNSIDVAFQELAIDQL